MRPESLRTRESVQLYQLLNQASNEPDSRLAEC